MSGSKLNDQELRGSLAGLLCYVFWGLAPLYWKLLDGVNSLEVIGQRIIWCFVLMVIICAVMRVNFLDLLRDKRAISFLAPAALLISINWGVYIYAVDTDRVVHTAMGYYCNPLVSILFGVMFFKEKLSSLQKAAVALCLAGVVYFLFDYGELPWISITLAVSFGLYGAIKKKGGYPAIPALAVESTLALPLALAVVFATAYLTGSHAFMGDVASVDGWILTLLVIGAGPVTAIPLVLFAQAANSIPLSMLGFIQYVSPTIALLLGVLAFGEPFTPAHAVCFGCIWAGLALASIDTLRKARKAE
ncbi:MAG: EamA family transporter RarD [Eggerthellaceae bacterium]|nr:EamA family transporter RarD [Eggerthellaceae bacterium]